MTITFAAMNCAPKLFVRDCTMIIDIEMIACVTPEGRPSLISEEEYAEASDALLDESDALCTGEFITMDGAFFVEMDAAGETEEYESVEFDDVDFC